MSLARLTRPAQTWALALESAFVDPAHPTIAELNDRRFVHFISCALTEDGTELTLGDSETDSTITFCSIGNEVSLTQYNATGNIQWLCDANTGGSCSTRSRQCSARPTFLTGLSPARVPSSRKTRLLLPVSTSRWPNSSLTTRSGFSTTTRPSRASIHSPLPVM